VITETERNASLKPIERKAERPAAGRQGAPVDAEAPMDDAGSAVQAEDEAGMAADKQKTAGQISDRPVDSLELRYSDNWMEVYIAPQGEGWSTVTLEEVKTRAASEGIRYGLTGDDRITAYLKQETIPTEPLLLARGKNPLPGEPDEIKYFFETDPYQIGSLSEDGTMDWKDRGQTPHVTAGTPLAEIIPGKEGETGVDVFGKTVLPPRVSMIKLSCGKGVEKSADGLKFQATVDGQPHVSGSGALSVLPTLTIDGNVGVETGHVIFDGHIQVKGSIESGYRVQGESLEAREILHAEVRMAGDVIVQSGIYGSQINTGGRLKAHHINQSQIVATGDVVVKKEVVESKIETNSRFAVDGGTILSSEIAARKGVGAGDIGSEAAKPSTIVVGVDLKTRRDIEKLRQEVAAQEASRKNLEGDIALFKESADRVNTELGEIAQVQDRRMVAKRELEEKLRTAADDDDRKVTQNARAAIVEMEAEIREIDQKVDSLLAEDEQLTEKIAAGANDLKTIDTKIEELRHRIREILELAEIDKGVPIVKFSGTVFPRNQIKGPHASLVIEECVQKGAIREFFDEDPEARRPWQMRITKR
jgi:uncharacterized protein (DUF342 family)